MARKSHSPQVLPSPYLPASESFDKLPASIDDPQQQHTPMMPTIQCCSLCTSPTSADTASPNIAREGPPTTTIPNNNPSKPHPAQPCTHADPTLLPKPLVLHGGRHAARELSLSLPVSVPVIQINGEPVEKEEVDEIEKKDTSSKGKGKAKIPTGDTKPAVARHDDWLRKMERALHAKAGISG